MDDRLQKALEFSNYRVSLFNIKENIKIKVDTLLTYAINGGIFKATTDLITFTKFIVDTGRNTAVIIDINQNPIEILDILSFHNELVSKYFEATNYYNVEYSKLKKSRSVLSQYSDLLDENIK